MSIASQVSALATAIGNNIQALTTRVTTLESDTAALVQQDGADTGRTVFVQFTGDSDPGSPIRGDIRIKET